MIRDDTDDLIAFLNSLLGFDPYAVAELLCIRVPCNEALANHASVQVVGSNENITFIAPGTWRVGILGLLNGYCGIIDDGPRKGWGPIGATYEHGKLVRFERTDRQIVAEAKPSDG